jgi:hypothetical protein
LKRLLLIVAIFSALYSEDFISEFEYGQMLYQNPRGVSCAKCHGKLGDGEFIASFKDNNNTVYKFYGPDIRGLDKKSFSKALEKGGKIMPRYYLTKKEIEAIFKYIKEVNGIKLKDNNNTKNGSKNLDDVDYNEITEFIEKNGTEVNITIEVDDTLEAELNSMDENSDEGGIINKIFKTEEEIKNDENKER